MLLRTDDLEEVGEVRQFAAAAGRGAADEVENLAVLKPVIGEAGDPAILIEIDCDDPLLDHLLRHEGRSFFRTLGNVVEGLTAHGRDRRGCTEDDQHLLLA